LRAVIVADGDIRPGPAVSSAIAAVDLVVAADGGAMKAVALGLTPAVVVGDGDSLSQAAADRLRQTGADVIVHPVDKDESDTELAVREAVARGATSVVILGALGGPRIEHGVANLLLLTLPELAGIDASIADGSSTVRVIGASAGSDEIAIDGSIGDYVSLLPLSERVAGVATTNMRFPLEDATLIQGHTRGLSNELSATRGTVRLRSGRLAVIHTLRSEGAPA
jgi:thiamine pyrophosphokinase